MSSDYNRLSGLPGAFDGDWERCHEWLALGKQTSRSPSETKTLALALLERLANCALEQQQQQQQQQPPPKSDADQAAAPVDPNAIGGLKAERVLQRVALFALIERRLRRSAADKCDSLRFEHDHCEPLIWPASPSSLSRFS